MDVGTHFNLNGEPWKVKKVVSPTEVEIKHLISGVVSAYNRTQFLADYLTESLVLPTPSRGDEETEVWLLSDWPQRVQQKIKFRLKWVQLVDKHNVPRSESKLKPFIKEHKKDFSKDFPEFGFPSAKSVQIWYRSWIKAGRHPLGLMSGDDTRKRSIRIQRDLNKLYEDGIEEIYFSGPETTATDVKDWVAGKVHEEPYLHLSEEKISLSTIERRIAEIDEFERIARKFGRKYALNIFSSRKNVTVPLRALEVVEIDETWADIFVIDDEGTPLGRPNIIFVVDVYSRMILSIHISFQNPSSSTVLHAIKQAIFPKNHIMEQLLYVNEDWTVWGIPDAIKSDNIQHYLSDDFLESLDEVEIDHVKCPVGKPNFKGIVERLFGKISQLILSKAPGYAKPLKQRFTELDLDPERTAVFTIDEVREILFKYFIDVYCHDYQEAIEGTPAELWEESVNDYGVRFDKPLEKIELAMRNTGESSIQNDGLTFERIAYDSDELKRLRERLKQKRLDLNGKKNPTVVFKYSTDDLGHIYVRDIETKKYLKVNAVDQEYARGLTYHQHKEIRKMLNEKKHRTVNQKKLRKAKKELIEICLGYKSNHKSLIPQKKIAKIVEKQFGSIEETALAIFGEFDSDSASATPATLPLTKGTDLNIIEESLATILELGDDDV